MRLILYHFDELNKGNNNDYGYVILHGDDVKKMILKISTKFLFLCPTIDLPYNCCHNVWHVILPELNMETFSIVDELLTFGIKLNLPNDSILLADLEMRLLSLGWIIKDDGLVIPYKFLAKDDFIKFKLNLRYNLMLQSINNIKLRLADECNCGSKLDNTFSTKNIKKNIDLALIRFKKNTLINPDCKLFTNNRKKGPKIKRLKSDLLDRCLEELEPFGDECETDPLLTGFITELEEQIPSWDPDRKFPATIDRNSANQILVGMKRGHVYRLTISQARKIFRRFPVKPTNNEEQFNKFYCIFCGYYLITKLGLIYHIISKHGDSRVECKSCSKLLIPSSLGYHANYGCKGKQ